MMLRMMTRVIDGHDHDHVRECDSMMIMMVLQLLVVDECDAMQQVYMMLPYRLRLLHYDYDHPLVDEIHIAYNTIPFISVCFDFTTHTVYLVAA